MIVIILLSLLVTIPPFATASSPPFGRLDLLRDDEMVIVDADGSVRSFESPGEELTAGAVDVALGRVYSGGEGGREDQLIVLTSAGMIEIVAGSSSCEFDLGLEGEPVAVAAGDVDGDGWDDIAVLTSPEEGIKRLRVFLTENSTLPYLFSLKFEEIEGFRLIFNAYESDIAMGDFDGDGNDEIAVILPGPKGPGLGTGQEAPLTCMKSSTVKVFDPEAAIRSDFTPMDFSAECCKSFTISKGWVFTETYSVHPYPVAIAAGDIDMDGADEIAVLNNFYDLKAAIDEASEQSWLNEYEIKGGFTKNIEFFDPQGDPTPSPILCGVGGLVDIAIGNVDSDGKNEAYEILVLRRGYQDKATVYAYYLDTNELTVEKNVPDMFQLSQNILGSRLEVGDLDGDSKRLVYVGSYPKVTDWRIIAVLRQPPYEAQLVRNFGNPLKPFWFVGPAVTTFGQATGRARSVEQAVSVGLSWQVGAGGNVNAVVAKASVMATRAVEAAVTVSKARAVSLEETISYSTPFDERFGTDLMGDDAVVWMRAFYEVYRYKLLGEEDDPSNYLEIYSPKRVEVRADTLENYNAFVEGLPPEERKWLPEIENGDRNHNGRPDNGDVSEYYNAPIPPDAIWVGKEITVGTAEAASQWSMTTEEGKTVTGSINFKWGFQFELETEGVKFTGAFEASLGYSEAVSVSISDTTFVGGSPGHFYGGDSDGPGPYEVGDVERLFGFRYKPFVYKERIIKNGKPIEYFVIDYTVTHLNEGHKYTFDLRNGEEYPPEQLSEELPPSDVTPIKTVAPGESATFKLILENTGTVRQNIELEVEGEHSSWASLSENPVNLAPGEAREITVTISVPDQPPLCDNAPSGYHEFKVRAYSEKGIDLGGGRSTRLSDYVTVRVMVEERYALSLLPPDLDPAEVKPGETSVLIFPLFNLGNAPDTFALSLSVQPDPSNKSETDPSEWRASVGKPDDPIEHLSLNPGGSYNVPVYLTPPESLFVGDKAVIELTATSKGDESKSATAQVTVVAIDTKRPRPPENLIAIDTPDDQGGSITLRWTRSPDDGQGQNDVTHYYIYRSESPGGYSSRHTYTVSLDRPGSNVQITDQEIVFVDTDVADGVRYYYVVTAFDGRFESEPSNEASAVPIDNLPPPKVQGLTVQNPGTGGRLIISWDPSPAPDLAGYRIYYDTDISDGSYDGKEAAEGESPIEVDKDTTRIELTGLRDLLASEPDGSLVYYIAVTALDGEGNESEPSEAIGVPTGPELEFEPGRFELVRNTAVSPSAGLILRNLGREPLEFELSKDVDWLEIEPSRGRVSPGSELSIELSYAGDLEDGEYSCELILSTNDPDEGKAEVEVELIVDLTPPAPPQAVEARDTLKGGSVMVSWSPSPEGDVIGYRVYWGEEKGPPYRQRSDLVEGTAFELTGLENGREYHIAVSAVDEHGNEGNASSEAICVPHRLVSHSARITAPQTWRYGEIHAISGGVSVLAELKVEPGAVIKLKKGSRLILKHDIAIRGTPDLPVIFTSWADDEAGGDTNGDGLTDPRSCPWNAVEISGCRASFEGCVFRYGGAGAEGMIRLGSGSLRMRNCVVSDSSSDGVYVVECESISIEGCRFENNSGYSITIPFELFDSVKGNDLTGERGIRLRPGSIGGEFARDVAWENPGVPIHLVHTVGSSFTVRKNSSLSIAPGTVLKFNPGGSLIVQGALKAIGTPDEPILFTSIYDDAGGDTNGDGDETKPAPGLWEGIKASGEGAELHLRNCIIRYGGKATGPDSSAIRCTWNASIELVDCVISHSASDGVWIDTDGEVTVRGNRFERNNGFPITIRFDLFDSVGENDFTGQMNMKGIRLLGGEIKGGNLSREVRWDNPGVPIYLSATSYVREGSSLSISPGIILKLGPDVSLIVEGRLRLRGTPQEPVLITSIFDDTGGDTNGDGVGSHPLPGDWGSMRIKGELSAEYAIVRFGGEAVSSAAGSSVDMRCVLLTDNSVGLDAVSGRVRLERVGFSRNGIGLRISGPELEVSACNFEGNRDYAASVAPAAPLSVRFDLSGCWWGDPSGPGPVGDGDVVGDRIDYEPWLRSPVDIGLSGVIPVFKIRPPIVSATVGDEVEVLVYVERVSHLAGCQFDLRFDPSLLEAVSVEEGGFMSSDGVGTFWRDPEIDAQNGVIRGAAVTRKGGTGIEGSGAVAIVRFKAKRTGSSALKLENVILSDVELKPIAVNVIDGSVEVVERLRSWDADRSGAVDIFDLVFVSKHFGETVVYPVDPTAPNPDVDGNGVVDIFDLVMVSKHFGEQVPPGAPSSLGPHLSAVLIRSTGGFKLRLERPVWALYGRAIEVSSDGTVELKTPDGGTVVLAIGSPVQELALKAIDPSDRIIAVDHEMRLLPVSVKVLPERTALLQNYPNPFNPDTWIPFQLREDAYVTIYIYDLSGRLVRKLDLGHLRAGYYTSRGSAAYWDGRNEAGERAASGVYIYQMRAGDEVFTRRMVMMR